MKINHRLPALTICIINVLFVKPSPSKGDYMFPKSVSPHMDFEKGMLTDALIEWIDYDM